MPEQKRETHSVADRHGGKIREAAAALGVDAARLLDFSANVNFLGPTQAVVAAARRAWRPKSCSTSPPT